MLQFLFSWNHLLKILIIESYGETNMGFNPYFPGVTFQSYAYYDEEYLTVAFQSLFSWSYLSKPLGL